jgi:hypothetical protein
MRSICVLFAFHSRSNCVPFAFHLRSTVTGTHLRNAFRLHSYRNRTSSEIIAISRVLVSLTCTFCVRTIKHETAFLYLLSTNESWIEITYDVHITYMYVRAQYSGTEQNTIYNPGQKYCALNSFCAKFDFHFNNKHNNPPFPRSMLCVVC